MRCPSRTAWTAIAWFFNAWAASTGKVNRFLLGEARKVIAGKDTVYFKRFYKDGSVRPARLRVNDFVAQHLGRQNGDACPPSDRSMHRRSTDDGARL